MDDEARCQWVASHILPHEGEARAWVRRHVHGLFTMVRNLLFEQARRARTVPMERMGEIEALRIPSEEPGPERRVGARQELERLERIVATLPQQCRRAFELQKFYNLSQREIAREMQITEKTVEKHLATALLRVLDALKADSDSARPGPESGMSRHGTEHSKD